jgi:hypothetical protein
MDIELIYTEATEGSHMDGGDGSDRGVHPSAYCDNTPALSILGSELEVHVASDGNHVIIIAGLMSQSLQLQVQGTHTGVGCCHKSRAKVCERISVCYAAGAVQVLIFF